jgi:anaerobic magnesium-protoporphyrin IX monomethyl ester cyclase
MPVHTSQFPLEKRDEKGERDPSSIAVLLIYPYFFTHAPNAMLFHPLGIAQLAAVLREQGLSAQVIDCTFEHREEVISKITAARPRIIGVYIMLSMSENALNLAREIRDLLPETLLVCGGPLPTLRPGRFSDAFDLIFCGEAGESFPRFCRDYMEFPGSLRDLSTFLKRPEDYPGLCYRDPASAKLVRTPSRASDEKALDRLPLPDRSDYDHSRYQRFWMELEGFSLAGIMTSYGCPFACDFCSKPIFGNRFRRRSMDRIFQEIRDIKHRGYTGLWIADDCFSLDPAHVRSFCRRMISEDLDMKWFCLSRVDRITRNDIDLWEAAGCRKVFFGLESGCNEVLELMNKKTTTEVAEQTVRWFAESNIRTAGFFIVGYPGETYASIEATFEWALSLPLDEISFTVPFPLPGAPLYSKVMKIDTGFDWQYENENRMSYQSDFDEDYLRRRIETVYEQFKSRRKAFRPQVTL